VAPPGFSGSDALFVHLRKAMAGRHSAKHSSWHESVGKSSEAFQKSLKEYLALFDVVPRKIIKTC